MRTIIALFALGCSFTATAQQPDLQGPFKACNQSGSTTIYDYNQQKWIFSDSADARVATVPASTFKIINLLIALETGVIKDENEVVRWVGKTDTTLYGYRPDIYKDMTVKEAFQVSAGWVFIELAKKIGKERYRYYLKLCSYGNHDPSARADDFWNFGPLAISPVNQVEILVKAYEGKLPFSPRNLAILKKVMITEEQPGYTIRSKTGWGRPQGKDIGWWVGYVERKEGVYFFATRLVKDRSTANAGFSRCRMDITRNILRQLKVIE